MSLQEKFETAKALFGESQYAESQTLLQEIAAAAGDDQQLLKQANMWLRKCSLHVPAAGGAGPTVPEATPAPAPAASAAPAAATSASAASLRFEWFQSLSNVTFTFYVKNRQASDVAVVVHGERAFEVTIKLDDGGREYQYHVDSLFASVVPTPVVIVKSMKVEVALPKATPYQWPALEVMLDDAAAPILAAKDPATVAAVTAPASAAQLTYPNSKGKDWSKVALEEKEEEGDKPSGDHALNALFKQIYGNASDDQRRAMMKSYQESNGTVLSTNWAEVGAKYVKGEPPKGMEMKSMSE